MDTKGDRPTIDRTVKEIALKSFDLWLTTRLNVSKTSDPIKVAEEVLKEPMFEGVDILGAFKDGHSATSGYSETTKKVLGDLSDSLPDSKVNK